MYRLGAFELASRLSYHFWEAPPDAELFDAARTGRLLEQDEYQRQLDRLFEDPRTRATVRCVPSAMDTPLGNPKWMPPARRQPFVSKLAVGRVSV